MRGRRAVFTSLLVCTYAPLLLLLAAIPGLPRGAAASRPSPEIQVVQLILAVNMAIDGLYGLAILRDSRVRVQRHWVFALAVVPSYAQLLYLARYVATPTQSSHGALARLQRAAAALERT